TVVDAPPARRLVADREHAGELATDDDRRREPARGLVGDLRRAASRGRLAARDERGRGSRGVARPAVRDTQLVGRRTDRDADATNAERACELVDRRLEPGVWVVCSARALRDAIGEPLAVRACPGRLPGER